MVKGSASQASTVVPRGSAPSKAGPVGASGAGLRRRPGRGGSSSMGNRASQGVMNFYTDDSPGLKISPVIVLVMSLGFIGFVAVLHIIGKLRGT